MAAGTKKSRKTGSPWKSWKKLFKAHPRDWYTGIDTTTTQMKGGILDSQGRLVLEDDGTDEDIDRSAMLAFAVNELTDDAIKRGGG